MKVFHSLFFSAWLLPVCDKGAVTQLKEGVPHDPHHG